MTGVLITIEGTDGSGKATQSRLLAERLKNSGYNVSLISFPRYDQQSSYFVKEYLNGQFAENGQLNPYTASLFYALDRFAAKKQIEKALAKGHIVISDRYVGSNMAHQGSKFEAAEERRGFFMWVDKLEYSMLAIPRPAFNIVLKVPAKQSQKQIDKKEARSYSDKKRDIHENDINHLDRSIEVYQELCQLFPKDYSMIDCMNGNKILSVPNINSLIFKRIQPILPKPSKKTGQLFSLNGSTSSASTTDYIKQNKDGRVSITRAGYEFLESILTNTKEDVYAFNHKISPLTVAAAMARLSRRGDDLRITFLDEFAGDTGKDEDLLKRVITAYGDDSVQQLVGLHVVVENASNLLTKKLEWGRLAAYLEQSTRYIYFDQKDKAGHYNYFVPTNIKGSTRKYYIEAMDQIFDRYSAMVHKLTDYVQNNSDVPETERDGAWRSACRAQACDAIRPVLPVATKSTVGIFASGQALESLIMHLLADDLQEARQTGEALLAEARKVIPAFLERADKPDRGGATTAYNAEAAHATKEIADKLLPQELATETEEVTLTAYWPRNELDIIPDILYPHSNLSLQQIKVATEKLTYNQKMDIMEAFVGERLNRRHKPGRALENIHYSWDIVCEYGIFRDLQRHRMVDDLSWQQLTPRYGYEFPELVEKAGLSEQFEECFDISLELFSRLQSDGYDLDSQYATLLGHKMRWKITYNAREAFHLHELRTTPQGHPTYRRLVLQMHQKLSEVHPILGDSMQFVNKSEDPELTRLAAERYTNFKLRLL